jgi:GT2 family glycosyltransferase/SAM-dependent methyltransferase
MEIIMASESQVLETAVKNIAAGRLEHAEFELQELYKTDDRNLDCLYLLSEISLRLNKVPQAKTYSDAALEIDPEFFKAFAVQIELSVRDNDLVTATTLLKKYPTHSEMHGMLQARVSLAQGDFEGALFDIANIIERDPKVLNWRELFAIGAKSVLGRRGKSRVDDFIDALGLQFPPSLRIADTLWSDPEPSSIDVIIPVHNALSDLRKCLKSLQSCADRSLNQIIIVDDASDESTANMLQLLARSNSNIILIRNQENEGFTRSCSRGILASKAPFFVLLNSDTIVSPGWMRGLWRGLDTDDNHSMAGPLSNIAYFQSIGFPVDLAKLDERAQISAVHFASKIIGSLGPPEYRKVPFLSGFCVMIRRSSYDTVGGFDLEAYSQGYWEIQDLSFRMIDCGLFSCLVDDVFVYHKQGASTAAELQRQLLEQGFKNICSSSGAIRVLFAEEICRNMPILAAQNKNLLHNFPMHAFSKDAHVRGRPGNIVSGAAKELFADHAAFTGPGSNFETLLPPVDHDQVNRAKVLAYYLPQFHQVDVNDAAWGTGFTEWRQLARAIPRFAGHLQPRTPRDLGFYDLVNSDVLRRQIEMARDAGIHGFCFYHYSFDGNRVLEAPVEGFLQDSTLDFPFCLIWANENWTRTWDGSNQDVLLRQTYDDAFDETMVDDFARHMLDSRYIRIGGRPLLILYRPGHIKDIRRKIKRWREMFRLRHGLEPLLFMSQTFFDADPRKFGLDGAMEFPPHKLTENILPINDRLQVHDPDFQSHVFDYDDLVQASLREGPQEYPLIKTAIPSWDNEPRRPGRGTVVHGSTPAKFQSWMEALVQHAQDFPVLGEAFVCVNAWNEWAEGAVLEPDVHHGAAYLNAVSRAIRKEPHEKTQVSFRNSAPIVSHLGFANIFQSAFGELSFEEWVNLLIRSISEPVIDGVEFPSFPPSELQNSIHGHSGAASLHEAASFYKFVQDQGLTGLGAEWFGRGNFLDFGAGWGRITRLFMRDFPLENIVGHEPSSRFCQIAQANNKYVNFISGDYMPDGLLPEGRFDLVVGWSVFSHLPPKCAGAWLAELQRVTRPGAAIVLTTWGRRFLQRLAEEKVMMEAGHDIHWYSQTVLDACGDLETRIAEYDNGDFVWFSGQGLDLYGDAFIGLDALMSLLKEYAPKLSLTKFDTKSLAQDVFVLRRA